MAGNVLGKGYLAGIGMAIGTTFGRIAGEEAARRCPRVTCRWTNLVAEAQRVLAICNACRYCEGYCAVFPALERRLAFDEGDIHYLANLCHNCGACLYACQYAPPHEFAAELPARAGAGAQGDVPQVRVARGFSRAAFERNGVVVERSSPRWPRALLRADGVATPIPRGFFAA